MAEHTQAHEHESKGSPWLLVLAGLAVVALLFAFFTHTTESEQNEVVLRAGAVDRVYEGRTQAGLHFRIPWPVERVVEYDARIFTFEDTHDQVQTNDKQNVLVTLYCAWRIGDPRVFQEKVKTVDAAERGLRDLLRSHKKQEIGSRPMSHLVNTNPDEMKLEEVERTILSGGPARDGVRQEAMRDYGVEVIRVGVKRLNLPESVTGAVIEAMKEERQREAQRFTSDGEAVATAIRKRAEQAKKTILAFARARAAEIRSEGDQLATSYYERFSQEPEFAMFLRWLEGIEAELQGKTTLLFDGSRQPALQWFLHGLPKMTPQEWKDPPMPEGDHDGEAGRDVSGE